MSVLIKGMEMPKNCDECFFVGRGFPDWCSLPQIPKDEDEIDDTNNRPDWCPLEEVPETHDKRTETHSCDLIDRQDAIRIVDSIDTWQAGWRGNAIESLKAMPSAQPEPSMEECACCLLSKPERKRGKWIHERLASTAGGSYPVVRCSECQGAIPLTIEYHYCPICGADMRKDGEANESD